MGRFVRDPRLLFRKKKNVGKRGKRGKRGKCGNAASFGPHSPPVLDQLVAMDPHLPGSHDLLCGGDQEGKLGELLELGDTVVRPSILL